MAQSVVIAGVGMVPFKKPGDSKAYHEMGAEAARLALADAGVDYTSVQQAYAGYVYGDSTVRPARALRRRHERRPHRQRQQQLLVRIDGPVPGATGRRVRHGRLRPGGRLRADAAGRAGRGVARPALRARQVQPGGRRPRRRDRDSPDVALLRRCRARVHGALRRPSRRLRQGARQGQPACLGQPARPVPQGRERRGCAGLAGDLARRADAADGLPADLRRRCGDRRLRGLRQEARPALGRAHQGPGHDHRPRRHLRQPLDDRLGRLRDGARRGQRGLCQVRRRPEDIDVCELHDCFAQNEVFTYEALGFCPEGGADQVRRRGRQHLRRPGRHQSLRRPAVQGPSPRRHRPRAVLRVDQPAARHGRRPARSRARGWRCSTTWGSAARRS